MKRWAPMGLALGILLFLGVTKSPGTDLLQLDPYQKMAYRVKPAIVKVMAFVRGTVAYETEEGKKTDSEIYTGGSGSGFIVCPDGFVVTNGHVVETIHNFNTNKNLVVNEILKAFLIKKIEQSNLPLTKESALQLAEKLKPQVTDLQPGSFVILSNLKRYSYEIKQYSKAISAAAQERGGEGKDIAVLKIEGKDLPTVKLGDSDKVQLQELVFAFGYPGAADTSFLNLKSQLAEVTISRGTVSAVKTDFKGMPIIQSDVTISWGNSGGPSLNKKGEVIGVNSYIGLIASQFLGTFERAAGISFIVPVNAAKEFLNAAGAKEAPSLFNEVYFQALEKIWAGRWFEGRDLLDKALVFLPEQPDLLALRMEAETAISRMGWFARQWQKGKTVILFSGLILLLLLGTGVFTMKKFRSRSQHPSARVESVDAPARVQEKGEATLMLDKDGQLGETYFISRKEMVIGREPSQCDIAIADPNVSRVHASVVKEKGEVILLDRGSTNGTFVNNDRVQRAVLKSGDVIHFGHHCKIRLIFKA